MPRLPWWSWLVLLCAAIEVVYVFIISAGTWTDWATWNTNYDLMAEGFRSGHLYIPVAPPPELLARANPFDWANSNLWFLDASLYKGHYYLYWGPVPALFLLAVKVAFRIQKTVGDQYLLFASYSLLLMAGTALISRLTVRLFPAVPRALMVLPVVAFAFVSPTTFMFATPGIYQGAIASAQAFLMLGLLAAFDAVWTGADGRGARLRLLLAGCLWGAAVGCRISAILPVAAFVALTALFASSADWRRWRPLLGRALYLGIPVAIVLAGLAVYNHERFGSWTEIGAKYQLNVFPFVTSAKYVPLNLYSYLLRPLGRSCRFPFLSALYDIGARGFPRGTTFPPAYTTHEPQAGLFVTSPWTWLIGLGLGLAIQRAVRWRRAGQPSVLADRVGRSQVWCLGCFAALAFAMPLVFIPAFGTTMRYVADFSGGFVLLSSWGAWALWTRLPAGWPRWAALVGLVALALATVVIGLLLGWEGYDQTFKWHNPALYERVLQKFSLCR